MENGDALYAICKLKAPLLAYLFAKDKEANITTTVAQSKVLIDPGCGKRIKFQRYYTKKHGTVRWLRDQFSCKHGRRPRNCKECGGNGICEHGRQRNHCKECGGSSFCKHGRERYICKECGGNGICEHGRERTKCKECGGGSICEHGRIRYSCKECLANVQPFTKCQPCKT